MFVPSRYRQPSRLFVSKARSLPLSVARLEDHYLALLANIRLGWEGLLGTSTLEYCKQS
jgi:hypothetical protein